MTTETQPRMWPRFRGPPPVRVQNPDATPEMVARALGFVPPHQRPEV